MSNAEPDRSVPARDAQSVTFELAALGALLPKFAHECNNRLTVILSCLDLLRETAGNDSDRQEMFTLANDAARLLASEVHTYLGLGRQPCAPPEPLDARRLEDDLVERMKQLGGAHVEFAGHDPRAAPARIVADREVLLAVLLCVHSLATTRGARQARVESSIFDHPSSEHAERLRTGLHWQLRCRWSGAEVPPDRHEFQALAVYAQALRGRAETLADRSELRVDLALPIAT
jgi:hypothetical protein